MIRLKTFSVCCLLLVCWRHWESWDCVCWLFIPKNSSVFGYFVSFQGWRSGFLLQRRIAWVLVSWHLLFTCYLISLVSWHWCPALSFFYFCFLDKLFFCQLGRCYWIWFAWQLVFFRFQGFADLIVFHLHFSDLQCAARWCILPQTGSWWHRSQFVPGGILVFWLQRQE